MLRLRNEMTFDCAYQTCEGSGLGEGFIYFAVSFSGNGRCGGSC
jgi:hypothetical protein